MEPFSVAWAVQCMGGQLFGEQSRSGQTTEQRVEGQGQGVTEAIVTSVCVDSRQVTPGALFFALEGEHTDGHRYVVQALEAGAAAVVAARVEGVQGAQIVVPAPLRALGDLARHYRQQFAIPIVGVTGSVGKTSTKEMIAAVLRTVYTTLASAKNYNNEIGVPLTLFQLDKTHQAAVIEMGMRGLGQIDYLAEIARPTVGVITNIGYAHIELLGSQENIARAKSELFARLPSDGAAILAEHNWPVLTQQIPNGCRKITFALGSSEDFVDISITPDSLQIRADGAATFEVQIASDSSVSAQRHPDALSDDDLVQKLPNEFPNEFSMDLPWKELSVQLPTRLPVRLKALGAHHVPNALGALAAAYALDIPIEPAVRALEEWQGAEGRMVARHTFDGITVLDDCYNASPESMNAALDTLLNMAPNGVAILGDMKELGDYAVEIHRQIGRRLLLSNLRLLITVGSLAGQIAEVIKAEHDTQSGMDSRLSGTDMTVIHFGNATEAIEHVNTLIRPGDTVLVKGSRAMGMEIIVNALTGEQGSDFHA